MRGAFSGGDRGAARSLGRRVFVGAALSATIALLCALYGRHPQRAAMPEPAASTAAGAEAAAVMDGAPCASILASLAEGRTVAGRSSLEGTVVDEAGRPIPEARVAVLYPGDVSADAVALASEGRLALSDVHGRFSIPAQREGGAVLCVRHAEFRPASCPVVEAAGPVTVVMRAGLEIPGRVLGPRGGEGIPGLHVVARGAGANVQTSAESTFSASSVQVQHATTDGEGNFVVRGLSEGAYQLDVVDAGLVSFPGRWEVGPGFALPLERVWATAGRGERATLRVVPVTMALVRAVDASNGASVVGARIAWTPPEGFLRVPFTLGDSLHVFVAAGVTVDARSVAIGQASAILLMSLSWPLRTRDVECLVTAEGYESETTRVRLHAVGERGATEPYAVALQPLGPRGTCRLLLRDAKGSECGPVVLPLRLSSTSAETVSVDVVFDEHGGSQWLSLPAGTTTIDGRAEWARIRSPVAARIGGEARPEVPITLASGGVLVRAVDAEDGRPLDDWGYRMGTGTSAPETRVDHDGGSLLVSGVFIRTPGTGGCIDAVALTRVGGPWTIEVVRHGYRNGLKTVEVVPGEIAQLTIAMVRDPGVVVDEWQSRPTWHVPDGARLRHVESR